MSNILKIVAKIQELCSPSKENFPSNINKEAIPVWEYVISKYSDAVYTNERSIDNQWTKAIRIFEKCCKNRNINPYYFNEI